MEKDSRGQAAKYGSSSGSGQCAGPFCVIRDVTKLEQLLKSNSHPADATKYSQTQRWSQGAPAPCSHTHGHSNEPNGKAIADLAKRLDAIEGTMKSIENSLAVQLSFIAGELSWLRQMSEAGNRQAKE